MFTHTQIHTHLRHKNSFRDLHRVTIEIVLTSSSTNAFSFKCPACQFLYVCVFICALYKLHTHTLTLYVLRVSVGNSSKSMASAAHHAFHLLHVFICIYVCVFFPEISPSLSVWYGVIMSPARSLHCVLHVSVLQLKVSYP